MKLDKLIDVLIALALTALLASVLWGRPSHASRGPESAMRAPTTHNSPGTPASGLRLTWRWEGCYVTATGCASWTGCDWTDADWVCIA